MVLANAEELLSGLTFSGATTSRRDDVNALVRSLAVGAKWDTSKSIPMWGELSTETLNHSSAVAFSLTRMVARVNVEYNPKVASAARFDITSVRVYNYSTNGALVPITPPVGGFGTELRQNPLLYDGFAAKNTECKDKIYLFEAPHNGKTYSSTSTDDGWIDNPCLVVGGKFSPDGVIWPTNESYYRVDFIDHSASPEQWLSLLRNHSYNVSITSVSGEGYKDPDIALKSAPFNITSNVLEWNEREMGEIVFDGQFYLSVDRGEFQFPRAGTNTALADRSNVVRIKTDFVTNNNPADADSGWSVDKIVDEFDHPLTWVRLAPSKRPAGWAPGNVDEAHFAFDTNDTTTNRTADVWIKAGRLRYKIRVVQTVLSLDLLDLSLNPIDNIAFVIPDGGTGAEIQQDFWVRWTPCSKRVKMTGVSPVPFYPFEPAWGQPEFPQPDQTPPAVSYLIAEHNAPNGIREYYYRTTLPKILASELSQNPFYERTTDYTFKIENNGEVIEKTMRFSAIHYALVVDTHKYRLDGGTHTITARSNARWRITKVDEWLYNIDPATLPASERPQSPVMLNLKTYDNLRENVQGGPNTNGEALAFTVVDNKSSAHKDKWGTVYVTIESVDGLFSDQTVEIPFPPATRLVLGLGPGLDVRGYNIGIPTPYHLNSAFRMVNSPYNFGAMDESVFKVEGLRVLGYNFMGAAATTPSTSNPDFNWHRGSMKAWLNNLLPDVIVISSNPGEPAILETNDLRLLKEYLNNGGVVILCSHTTTTQTKNVLNALLGTTNLVDSDFKYRDEWGRYFRFLSGAAGSMFVDGPFSKNVGGLVGKNWGAHSYTTGVRTAALPSTVVPLSTMMDMSGGDSSTIQAAESLLTSAFYDSDPRNKFVYIGNGCVMASYYDSLRDRDHTYDPFDIDDNLVPTPALDWGRGANRTQTYNAHFIANTLAWAIEVTNHTSPAGGYQ